MVGLVAVVSLIWSSVVVRQVSSAGEHSVPTDARRAGDDRSGHRPLRCPVMCT